VKNTLKEDSWVDVNIHWIRQLVNQFTGNVCDKIVMPKFSNQEIKPKGTPVLDLFKNNIEYKEPTNTNKIDALCNEFEKIIKSLDMKYMAKDGFTPSLVTNSRIMFWWFMAARSLNTDFISKIELDTLLGNIEIRLARTDAKKHESAYVALDDFRKILNSYRQYTFKGLRTKTTAFSSSQTLWELEDIIMRDKAFRKACSMADSLSQQGTRINYKLRKLGEKICDISTENEDFFEIVENNVSIPTSGWGKVGIPIPLTKFFKWMKKRERLPVIYNDNFDMNIPEGKSIKQFPEGHIRRIAGRCVKCSGTNTEIHKIWGTFVENGKKGWTGGYYLLCKDCEFNEFDEVRRKHKRLEILYDIPVKSK